MFIDALDSFYLYVRNRLQAANSNRIVKGVVNAQDWPKEKIIFDAFYLLELGDSPAAKDAESIANSTVLHQLQWTWVCKGADLTTGIRQNNLGTRYRTAQLMKGELMHALFPYYAEKQTWAPDPTTGKWTGSPVDASVTGAYMFWTKPVFMEKLNKESGVLYGSASVRLADLLEQITA